MGHTSPPLLQRVLPPSPLLPRPSSLLYYYPHHPSHLPPIPDLCFAFSKSISHMAGTGQACLLCRLQTCLLRMVHVHALRAQLPATTTLPPTLPTTTPPPPALPCLPACLCQHTCLPYTSPRHYAPLLPPPHPSLPLYYICKHTCDVVSRTDNGLFGT